MQVLSLYNLRTLNLFEGGVEFFYPLTKKFKLLAVLGETDGKVGGGYPFSQTGNDMIISLSPISLEFQDSFNVEGFFRILPSFLLALSLPSSSFQTEYKFCKMNSS